MLRYEYPLVEHKTSHLGKPSVKDCCKYLNLGVSDKKDILVKNLVEKLMSEIGHVTESAFRTLVRTRCQISWQGKCAGS